ncbi:ABC transporter permease [Paenibacillus mucilaginosus]|uniref:Binding-protein-dependent transport system inner membrane component n=1 Tax=Paenibacillus mucilaginosus (strain KNP414) TaxID=1036673 RepID=F8FRS3_PAEMK|nr:ABC transporter permease subunit [Paenibacillus mucilaginosus]AEI40630.1 binding-protein-dependent transport system inner membrane component [Paenibacillus mucilaginosus KNP414]MCG7216244.1 ABC transporter permease subunit [Paenibacillus mucilaginosus]WDM29773.1 sugar ABC transporter permease [Paenibacillus mucilaginosus]
MISLRKDLTRNKWLYLMMLPVLVYYIAFHYAPMYGAMIAFKQFVPAKGIWGSEWVGFKHFESFFSSIYFFRVIKNTVLLSLTNLVFGFPAPIILALLLNELKSSLFRRITQTITYMPHFITLVVVAGIIRYFTLSDGLINDVIAFFGGERAAFLQQAESFRAIYVISEIWQQVGWGTIIYLAAIAGIDQQQYEAAKIDGATKLGQIWHITLPGILPTVMIMLILALGNLMNVGFEKIILLYSASIYETADVISTFVYRKGILEFNYGYSTAVGLFNSLINFGILLAANYLSKKVSQNSLW